MLFKNSIINSNTVIQIYIHIKTKKIHVSIHNIKYTIHNAII